MFTFRKNGHFYEKIGKKGEPVCIDDELPFDIPDTWEWTRIKNIVTKLTDGAHKTPKYVDKGIPFLSVKDMSSGYLDFSDTKFISQEDFKRIYQRCNYELGDILLTKVGTTGIPIIINTNKEFGLFVSVALLKFNHNFIYNEFLVHVINSPVVQLQCIENTKGVGNKNWVLRDIGNTIFPLPPLNEQKRIVNKIREFLPLIDEYGKEEYKLDQLNSEFSDKLKSSILQEAIQGKLVLQNPTDEPASELLEKIREEKERLIKEKKIKRNKNESYIFKENNHFYEKIGKEIFDITNEIPFEIPDNWMWCKLENITSNIHYGYTASAQEVGDVKLLRITDIHENNVNWDSVPYCAISENKLINYILKNRDIVMARTGGTIGKSYIINNLNKKAVFASYLIRIIPLKNINENYLKQFFESPLFWSQLRDNTKGTGQPNVNAKSLKSLLIPLPPFIEQEKIVIKIEKIFDEINLRLKV